MKQQEKPEQTTENEDIWVVKFRKNNPSIISVIFGYGNEPEFIQDLLSIRQLIPSHIPLDPVQILDIGQDTGYTVMKAASDNHNIIHEWLKSHSNVHWFEKQEKKRRFKRSFIDNFAKEEPRLKDQWHFWNSETTTDRLSMETWGTWESGITGKGVTVAVVDDGADITHEDLKDAYDPKTSWDLVNNQPVLPPSSILETHGTRCAGQIAARRNGKYGVGVAYDASLSVIRLIGEYTFDALEAAALTYKYNQISIYSLSWGPEDSGMVMEGPGKMALRAFEEGATSGRNRLGSIYVLASGNGGASSDCCGADGFAQSIYTITVGSIDESNRIPRYAESCPAQLVTAYGGNQSVGIATTDLTKRSGSWTTNHFGTSAAAPFVSGSIALLLQKHPHLSWRDVQDLLVHSAVPVNLQDSQWQTNGAGLKTHPFLGFGVLRVDKLMQAAEGRKNMPAASLYTYEQKVVVVINKDSVYTVDIDIEKPEENGGSASSVPYQLEHVELEVSLKHEGRGDVQIEVLSPSNTTSTLLQFRDMDFSHDEIEDWKMMSTQQWGEHPWGRWRVIMRNRNRNHAVLGKLSLSLRGVPCPKQQWVTGPDGKSMFCPWEVEAMNRIQTIWILIFVFMVMGFVSGFGVFLYRKRREFIRDPTATPKTFLERRVFGTLKRSESLESNRLRSFNKSNNYVQLKDLADNNDKQTFNDIQTIPVEKSERISGVPSGISEARKTTRAASPKISVRTEKALDLGQLPSPQTKNMLASPLFNRSMPELRPGYENVNNSTYDLSQDQLESPKSPSAKKAYQKRLIAKKK